MQPSEQKQPPENAFGKVFGPQRFPIILAPLAGVSDHPFRRSCARYGADLTYVEMLSSVALIYKNENTLDMLKRHPSEEKLGVQITGRSAEETARAAEMLEDYAFDTLDLNMGCPVQKIVKTGCGSAILKDPERVFQTVRAVRGATGKPLSAKIRIGWDHQHINAVEVAQAIEAGGADWMTIHGRTRSDDYAAPVAIDVIRQVKAAVKIPVIGNGNIYTTNDMHTMRSLGGVDGVMVSRAALGDPWVFAFLKGREQPVQLDEWVSTVVDHLDWQREEYGDNARSAVCMRKHLLWYTKGWPYAKEWRDLLNHSSSINSARQTIMDLARDLRARGILERIDSKKTLSDEASRFRWDPKFDMDRTLDRGVGAQGLY